MDEISGLPSGISRGGTYQRGGYVPCRLHTRILRPLGKAQCLELMKSGFSVETLGPKDSIEIRANNMVIFSTQVPVGLDGILQYRLDLRGRTYS